MNIGKCYSVSDFRLVAKRNIPNYVFDFVDGGAGNESALNTNLKSYQEIKLTPYIRNDLCSLSLISDVLGLKYSAPFGVAPLGLCGLINRESEFILAKAAAKYNVPFIASAASNRSIADIANACGVAPWFQLYIPKSKSYLDPLLSQAKECNCPVLVVTVDTCVPGRRLRDLKNGLSLPYGITFRHVFEGVRYPRWARGQIFGGKLKFPNFEGMLHDKNQLTFSEIMSLQTGGDLNWDVISVIRENWKQKLVLKGVLSEKDGIKAKKMGVDAIIVSNHGGRQLNKAPSPISVLPNFLKSGLDRDFLIIDSGIRSGEDILIALCRGAGFTFLGRAFLYALMAGGDEAVDRVFQILIDEINVAMKLIACDSPAALESKYICL